MLTNILKWCIDGMQILQHQSPYMTIHTLLILLSYWIHVARRIGGLQISVHFNSEQKRIQDYFCFGGHLSNNLIFLVKFIEFWPKIPFLLRKFRFFRHTPCILFRFWMAWPYPAGHATARSLNYSKSHCLLRKIA